MTQSTKLSDDLFALVQTASQALSRPLARQIEYLAGLGVALDAADISAVTAMNLLCHGASADAFVEVALGRDAAPEHGLHLLTERQRRDAEDVWAGRRTARSLWVIQKGDLDGYTFTPSSTSEFDQVGFGW